MSETVPTPGIHTGPVPPLAAVDPDLILSEHPEIDPGDGCRGCSKTMTHTVGCPVGHYGDPVRVGDTWPFHLDPRLVERANEAHSVPTLGDLAAGLRSWQRQGVTAESLQYAASKVWDTVNLLTVARVKRERDEILEEATRLISGDREDDYGSARDNFTRTGQMWAAILGADDITAEQVALMLAALKISRLSQNTGHRDSWVDLAGYAALGGDIAEETAADAAAYAQR